MEKEAAQLKTKKPKTKGNKMEKEAASLKTKKSFKA